MSTNEEQLIEWNAAGDMVAFAFMREVILELARREPDPAGWAKAFVDRMYRRQDQSEKRDDQELELLPVHEVARSRIDYLAKALRIELRG